MSGVLQEVPKPGTESGIEVTQALPGQEQLLTPAALAFLASLHRRFDGERQTRLSARADRSQIQLLVGRFVARALERRRTAETTAGHGASEQRTKEDIAPRQHRGECITPPKKT